MSLQKQFVYWLIHLNVWPSNNKIKSHWNWITPHWILSVCNIIRDKAAGAWSWPLTSI